MQEQLLQFLPLILIFGVFYFLIIRPQQQKMKTHQSMLSNLKRGDKVVTNGGLIGVITKIVSDEELQVEIAENVRVRVARAMIHSVFIKGEAIAVDKDSNTNSSAA